MTSAQTLNNLRIFSLLERAEFLAAEGRLDRARAVFTEAIEIDAEGFARLRFGEFLYQTGESEEAASAFQAALEIGRHREDHECSQAASQNLAMVYRALGESALAASYQQQAIAAGLRNQTEPDSVRSPLAEFLDLANEAISRGRLDDAEKLSALGIKLAQSQNCPAHLADAWGTWAVVRLLRCDRDSAWCGFLEAYAGHSTGRDDEGQIADLLNLAQTARDFGWWITSKRLLLKAGKVARRTGIRRTLPRIAELLDETNRVLSVSDRTAEWN